LKSTTAVLGYLERLAGERRTLKYGSPQTECAVAGRCYSAARPGTTLRRKSGHFAARDEPALFELRAALRSLR
jgi:hypothetical protein